MVIPDQSIAYQFVLFIVTWIMLNVLLIKPIRGVIQKRKELMAEQSGKIEKFSAEAEAKIKDYEAVLAETRKAGNVIRAEYKDQGSTKEHELMAAAGAEASQTLKEARTVLDADVNSALDALKKDVSTFAVKAADKVLAQ
ncbi:MAG: ATP synthase F0 subunit B [Proteobacteria bacterium]|nr:ATP synthase F0 subunit B [Pseudomonadota bacterium]MBU1610914.1 ATP synthase F0 subunit B [Pseudomonadota bacterium]